MYVFVFFFFFYQKEAYHFKKLKLLLKIENLLTFVVQLDCLF